MREPRRHAAAAVALAALLLLAICLTIAAHRVGREAAALRARGQATASGETDRGLDGISTTLLPSATLDTIAQHLPEGVALASIEARPGGAIRIVIDTSDPDDLRRAFADDPWLDRFRERGQEQHDDGSFRVVLEGR